MYTTTDEAMAGRRFSFGNSRLSKLEQQQLHDLVSGALTMLVSYCRYRLPTRSMGWGSNLCNASSSLVNEARRWSIHGASPCSSASAPCNSSSSSSETKTQQTLVSTFIVRPPIAPLLDGPARRPRSSNHTLNNTTHQSQSQPTESRTSGKRAHLASPPAACTPFIHRQRVCGQRVATPQSETSRGLRYYDT